MAKFIPRRHPTKGVLIDRGNVTIVFVTVCSAHRAPRLANDNVYHALIKAWREAGAWIVGAYVIMPDHLHFFCSRRLGYKSGLFTTGFGRMKAMPASGITSELIRLAPASRNIRMIGPSKAY
ncbi:MAG: hypothetical protein M3Z64_03375 [Verrucomicrobiota bacterium]|nr:hypothetical protein [Verrucomicrobiota bacterium]